MTPQTMQKHGLSSQRLLSNVHTCTSFQSRQKHPATWLRVHGVSYGVVLSTKCSPIRFVYTAVKSRILMISCPLVWKAAKTLQRSWV